MEAKRLSSYVNTSTSHNKTNSTDALQERDFGFGGKWSFVPFSRVCVKRAPDLLVKASPPPRNLGVESLSHLLAMPFS